MRKQVFIQAVTMGFLGVLVRTPSFGERSTIMRLVVEANKVPEEALPQDLVLAADQYLMNFILYGGTPEWLLRYYNNNPGKQIV